MMFDKSLFRLSTVFLLFYFVINAHGSESIKNCVDSNNFISNKNGSIGPYVWQNLRLFVSKKDKKYIFDLPGECSLELMRGENFTYINNSKGLVNTFCSVEYIPKVSLSEVNYRPETRNKTLIGVNTGRYRYSSMDCQSLFNSHFFQNLPKNILRFPGGTVGNYYRWELNRFSSNDMELVKDFSPYPHVVKWLSRSESISCLNEFVEHVRSNKIKICLVLNLLLYNNVEECLGLLDYFVNKGVDVALVELGNENYYKNQLSTYTNDYQTYFHKVKILINLIRTRYPNLKIGIPVSLEVSEWESYFIDNDLNYDYSILHLYSNFYLDYEQLSIVSLNTNLMRWHKILSGASSLAYKKKYAVTEFNVFEHPYRDGQELSTEAILSNLSLLLMCHSSDLVDFALYHSLLDNEFGLLREGLVKSFFYPIFKDWLNFLQKVKSLGYTIIPFSNGESAYRFYFSDGELKYVAFINIGNTFYSTKVKKGLSLLSLGDIDYDGTDLVFNGKGYILIQLNALDQ